MYCTDGSLLPENQEKRRIGAAPVGRRARMPGYVLTVCLLVGVVWSASAQQAQQWNPSQPWDPKLVGSWESYDGPCNPCTLTVPASGPVGFAQAGSAVQVVFFRATAEHGVDLILPQGGKLDLSLNKKGNYLVGFFTNWSQNRMDIPVSFERK